jgi:hypothetical protein
MNTTQTLPAPSALFTALQPPPAAPSPETSPAPHPVPALPAPHQALLADFDDPDLTTLDLARRHALTLDDLAAIAAAPAFARALALLRALAEVRRPLQIARAEARAAETLTALTARDPTSATAAKEVRLAVKDLLKLLGAAGFQPVDRPKADALGGAGFQPANRPKADPQILPRFRTGEVPERSGGGGGSLAAPIDERPGTPAAPAAPTPYPSETPDRAPARPRSPHKPTRPRGTKPRPKPRSR